MIVSPQAPKQLSQIKQLKGVLKAKITDQDRDGVAGSTAYVPKAGDENKFIRFHKVNKHEDRVGNSDDIFKAAKIKVYDRAAHRHGYSPKGSPEGEFAPNKTPPDKDAASAINPSPVVIVKGLGGGMSRGEGWNEEFTEENIQEDVGREQFLKVRGVSYEKYQQMTPNEKKAFNLQYKSWAMAARKIKKEEVQLDEISKALAGRYIKLASLDANDNSFKGGKAYARGKNMTTANHLKFAARRKNGISQATDKLTGAAKVPATNPKLVDGRAGRSSLPIRGQGS